jgi:acetate kinase
VFSGGIGENDAATRAEVVAGSAWLGAAIDPQRNAKGDGLVSADTSRIPVWVIATDEERLIARRTRELVTSGAL